MKFLPTLRFSVMLIMGVVLLSACRGAPATVLAPTSTVARESIISFPQQEPSNDGRRVAPSALITGHLVLVNGCLRLNRNEENSSYLVIWPPDVVLRTNNGLAEISNLTGQILVKVGQKIRLGGGELPASQSQWVSNLLWQGQKLPEHCPGPYWLVGHEISPA